MIGGIDQQIQQRVDAYRDNPQQLMQRYQQNQELIDLLAMQKLKSEKDAAAREIQMQMQTTPQTIKQQREAELLGRTKDEMVQQTSGIMQERQKRQQQNMQRTANQGLPQLPAGNMQRMAGGGIVAFAEGGGPLKQKDINAQLRQLIEAALELGESPEALAERLRDNPNALAILRSVQSQQIDRQASMGERPAEGMSIPDRAPSIDTTDIMSILNPSKPTKPVETVVPPTRLPEKEPSAPAMGERPEEARSLPRPSTRPVSAPVTPGPSIDTTNLASLLGPKPTPPYKPREEGGGLSSLLGASGVIDPVQRRKEREVALADRDQLAEKITAQREQQRQERLESSPLGGQLFKDNRLDSQIKNRPDAVLGGSSVEFDTQTAPQIDTPQTAPQIDTPQTDTPQTEVDRPDSMTVPQIDPRQQQMDQLQEIDTSGLAGLKKASLTPRESYEANRSVLSKELLRQQDPEKLRKERLRDFLIGAGGRSSFGSVMAGGTAASANRQAQQEAQKLRGIGSLMGVDEKLMTMDQEAQKTKMTMDQEAQKMELEKELHKMTMDQQTQRIELERESNRLLGEIRQGQLTAAQMNSIASEINSMAEQIESALMTDPVYIELNEQYRKAIEKDDKDMAEQLLRRREQYRQDKIKSVYPNYADLVKTQKLLNQRMLGSTGFGKVEKVPQ
jgi:hypothetical protein